MAITETASGNGSIAVTATATGTSSTGVAATSQGEESTALIATASGKGSDAIHANGTDVGIRARGTEWHGIASISDSTVGGVAVLGEAWGTGIGLKGMSKHSHGVHGVSEGPNGWGVFGEGVNSGVVGVSKTWVGVYGETTGVENGPAGVWGEHKGAGTGVKAVSKDGAGLAAYSTGYEAIHAETHSPGTAAIAAYNLNPEGTGAAIFAKKEGNQGHAGFFAGNVYVTGDLSVQGISIQALLQRIQQLEQIVADLSQRAGSGTPPAGPSGTQPLINATVELSANGHNLKITGNGFQTSETIQLNINYFPDANANGQTATFMTPADTLGFFSYGYGVNCPGDGTHPRWDIQATGISSGRTSNVTSAGC